MKIIKIPSSLGALGKQGSEDAPEKITECLKEFYVSEYGNSLTYQLSEVNINNSNLEETNINISNKAKQDDFTIFLGGDHSITYPILKEIWDEDTYIIIFDAHPDVEQYTETASHEDFLRKLIDEKKIPKENIVLIGLRNWSQKEFQYLKENKIKIFTMPQLFDNLENVADTITENAMTFKKTYVSIDIDAVDPAFAPGTGYTEPGGLSSRELLYFIQRLKKLKNLKAVDIVEVNPKKDINNMTSKLAAKIIMELA